MLKLIHYGSALGSTWAVVQGGWEDTSADGIGLVTATYGGNWVLPILSAELLKSWSRNPKVTESPDGDVVLVWLFKQV